MNRIEVVGTAGNRIVGERAGEAGPPVLLLHGGGQTRHAWAKTARALAKAGRRAFSFDQRGHGDSAWIASGAYGFADFGADAACLAVWIEAETGMRPALVGASLGGLAGLLAEASAAEGNRRPVFERLVLVDVTPSLNPEGLRRIGGFMTGRLADGFASLDEAAEAVALYLPDRARPASPQGLARNLRQRADGRFVWHWDPAFVSGPHHVFSGAVEAEARLRAAARLVRRPTLLVRGGRSDLVTEAELADFHALMPHAEVLDIAGAGHMVAGDRNDAFAAAILDHLAGAREAAG